jgi:hypothetical protein
MAVLCSVPDVPAQQERPLRVVRPAIQDSVSRVSEQPSDEEALKKADLSPTDGARLVAYLKLRTLSDSEQGKIAEIIERFGVDSFDERV